MIIGLRLALLLFYNLKVSNMITGVPEEILDSYLFYKGLYESITVPITVEQHYFYEGARFYIQEKVIRFGSYTNPAEVFSGDYIFPAKGLRVEHPGLDKMKDGLCALGHELIHWAQYEFCDGNILGVSIPCEPTSNPSFWVDNPLEYEAHSWNAWWDLYPTKAWDLIIDITTRGV